MTSFASARHLHLQFGCLVHVLLYLSTHVSIQSVPNTLLLRAGAREKVFFPSHDPSFVVGIVTCGGLCPGLNSVIRSLVITLWYSYGVRTVKGFRYGFDGLNSKTGKVMMCFNQYHHTHTH
jgi:hypothetical protein